MSLLGSDKQVVPFQTHLTGAMLGLSNKQITPCDATGIEITHFILLNCTLPFTETKSAHLQRRRRADWQNHVEYLHRVRHCSTYPPKQKQLTQQQNKSSKYHGIQTT